MPTLLSVKYEKRKCQRDSLNCGIHCGVHKLMHAEQFLPADTKVHTPIRAMVIMYIQPTDQVLEPPIEKRSFKRLQKIRHL